MSHAIDGKLCYMFGKSTNQLEYRKFLRFVKGRVKSSSPPCVLLYDGAPPHTTKKSVKLCESLFVPLKNIAHSSDFNSIVSEDAWLYP